MSSLHTSFYFLKLLCVFSVLDHKLCNPRTRVQRIQCQCWILRPCWPRGLPKARYPVSFLFEFCFNHVFHFNILFFQLRMGSMMENFFLSHRCDCGFFGLKYVENYDGKSMREFKQVHIFNFLSCHFVTIYFLCFQYSCNRRIPCVVFASYVV